MKTLLNPDRFLTELPGWALRGLLVALPSGFWAAVAEFNSTNEIAAMGAGVGVYVAGFAWFTSWDAMDATPGRERFVRALKMSAWIKSALLLGVLGAWLLVSGTGRSQAVWLACGVVPDMWLGVGSVSLVSWLAGVKELGLGQLNSFGWTGLTTLVQGGLITVLLLLGSLGVLGVGRLWAAFVGTQQLPPVRDAG